VQRSGAEIIWECLVRQGVRTVFGYPGGAILPAYDALLDFPIHHVLVRHEQGAAHMADGFARATGGLGVVIATSGPGATNLVTGIATAMMDSVPLLCITGQVPSHLIGFDAFQETDVTGITLPITKQPPTWRSRAGRAPSSWTSPKTRSRHASIGRGTTLLCRCGASTVDRNVTGGSWSRRRS
jgi:thiamine pyrophosphate-dependent acetolactate synthase large subunit-like protein